MTQSPRWFGSTEAMVRRHSSARRAIFDGPQRSMACRSFGPCDLPALVALGPRLRPSASALSAAANANILADLARISRLRRLSGLCEAKRPDHGLPSPMNNV